MSGTQATDTPKNGSSVAADRIPHGWITNRINRMTLEEKVGQLFVTYAYGATADTVDPRNQSAHGVDTAAELIDRYKLGGVIYFAWSDNLHDPQQIANLSNGLQQVAVEQRMHIPLLISTDQEHGIVTRVGAPATLFPGNMALGAGRSTDDARTAARISGAELRALGINQNFAPVADVNVNPENPVIGVRSFGENPQLTADLTAAQVAGYQERDGVAATAKHFPGHGDTDVDSHIGVPIINHSVDEWWELDAPPFQAAVGAGIDAIMTAHIVVPALDPAGDPATLSHPIMTGILRDELGYDGVVITDALTMQGVRDTYGDDQVPVLALKAGVDMLLMPPDIDLAYNAVLDAVRSGEISERRIDESVYRILRLKFQRGIFREPFVDARSIDDVVGTPEHRAEAQRITDATTTLITNDAGLLPLAADDDAGEVLVTGWGVSTTETLAEAIGRRGPATETFWTGGNPEQATIDDAVARAETADLVVVATMNARGSDGQQRLVKALLATGTPVVAVAVRDPYDIAYYPEAETYLATYSYTPGALEAVAKVIFGEAAPEGRLPVTIPVADNPGTVLYPYGHGLTYTSTD
ncbi:glycoside hydrolase family 3 protein [Phytoactinopolyspora halotolerans]|uniref:beta-N-acetylhexosaminidase n=2 Tax=Phytoactinopolyspora halotolerans TaxID=1981512 RepID=A0A6L9SDM3_9ACTN|nr:glycoside hydrolase family 3 protein [Phytoactinopolyspora halotolerans]